MDKDPIPTVSNTIFCLTSKFNGKRIKRGMYKSASGVYINADVNGALNILKKSGVCNLNALYETKKIDTPMRISII